MEERPELCNGHRQLIVRLHRNLARLKARPRHGLSARLRALRPFSVSRDKMLQAILRYGYYPSEARQKTQTIQIRPSKSSQYAPVVCNANSFLTCGSVLVWLNYHAMDHGCIIFSSCIPNSSFVPRTPFPWPKMCLGNLPEQIQMPPGPLMVKHAIGKGPWIITILLLRKLTIPHLLRIKIGEGCVLNIHTLPLQLAKSAAHSLDERNLAKFLHDRCNLISVELIMAWT